MEKPHFEHEQSQSSLPSGFQPQTPSDITDQFSSLRSYIDDKISSHTHDGGQATRINFNTDIIGLFETVSVVPTAVPKGPYDQVKIYVSGTTYRLYWYDGTANAWRYAEQPVTGLSGTKIYYVSDTSGGTVNRKLTFTNGVLTAET